MMARYIDADALKLDIDLSKGATFLDMALAVIKSVQEAPTADLVEVVRCKNCVKEGRFDCPLCYIENKTLQFINHDAEFYCGFGERKGESEVEK